MTDGMKGTAGIRVILGFITPFYSVITLYYSVVNPTEGVQLWHYSNTLALSKVGTALHAYQYLMHCASCIVPLCFSLVAKSMVRSKERWMIDLQEKRL